MKLRGPNPIDKRSKYQCYCGEIIYQIVGKSTGAGNNGAGTDMVKCLKCGNFVSQKTKTQIEIKLERGEKI